MRDPENEDIMVVFVAGLCLFALAWAVLEVPALQIVR